LARKSWFQRNKYDTKQLLTEDYELWVRAFLNNDFNVQLLEEPLYYYREEGNVTSAKILRAYASQRSVVRKYAANNISHVDFMTVWLSSYLKSCIVSGLSWVNMLKLLHQKRNGVIDVNVLNDFNNEIAIIRNTKVPGLD
jgi:hypothetical protein